METINSAGNQNSPKKCTHTIAVIGSFCSGRSTLINALFGKKLFVPELLPSFQLPSHLRWGAKETTFLHFRNPLPNTLSPNLPDKITGHIKASADGKLLPVEITFKELESLVKLPITDQFSYEPPFKKAEALCPHPFLKQGIEFIEIPLSMGGNLSWADTVIFILNAANFCTWDEILYLEQLTKEKSPQNLFLVISKCDQVRSYAEMDSLVQYAHHKLNHFTSNKIFFISASEAFEGKLTENVALLNHSGLPEFEKALKNHLKQ